MYVYMCVCVCVFVCMYMLPIPPVGEGGRKKIVNLLRVHLPKLPSYLGTHNFSIKFHKAIIFVLTAVRTLNPIN